MPQTSSESGFDSPFDDDGFDSVSAQSTIFDSDFVAAGIEKNHRELAYPREASNNHINLHINMISNGNVC